MRARIPLLAVSLTAALATAPIACGDDLSDGQRVAGFLDDVQDAVAAGDGAKVCDDLTPTGRYELARLRGGGAGACAAVILEIGRRAQPGKSKPALEVLSVKVRGGRAIARVRSRAGRVDVVPVLRGDDGAWKLTSLALLDSEVVDNPPYGPKPLYDEPARFSPPEVLYDVQTDFVRDRGPSVCNDLSAGGRREMGGSADSNRGCEDSVDALRRRMLSDGRQVRSSRVLAARIRGRRGTLVVKDHEGPRYRVPIVRESGRWLLTSLALAEPIAAAMTAPVSGQTR